MQDRTGQARTGSTVGREKNENSENENADTNGDAERFTQTAEQLRRIKANVDRGYES